MRAFTSGHSESRMLIDILLAINGKDSDGETMRFAWSLRWVPASQISLTAPHLHRLHIGPCPALAEVTGATIISVPACGFTLLAWYRRTGWFAERQFGQGPSVGAECG